MKTPPNGWTVKQLADRWSCSREHVSDLIQLGCLRALNIALPGAKRARYVVTHETLMEFEEERSVGIYSQPKTRPRKKPSELEEFFSK